MIMAQPNDVVTFLCRLDSCSEKRRTAVHARDCEAVGTSELSNYSTTDKGFTLRYAQDSLRTIYVPKLAMVYERDLGVTHVRNSTLRTGNPVRSGFTHAIHGLHKGGAEEGRSRSITGTCNASQPPHGNRCTHDIPSHRTPMIG